MSNFDDFQYNMEELVCRSRSLEKIWQLLDLQSIRSPLSNEFEKWLDENSEIDSYGTRLKLRARRIF